MSLPRRVPLKASAAPGRRQAMKRTGFRVRPRGAAVARAPLERAKRIQPVSAKRRAQWVQRTALLLALKQLVGYRCEFCDRRTHLLDGHEVRKPRSRYWLNALYVVMLCRTCHEMAEAAYSSTTGRLEIPGTRHSGWGFAVVRAANKWAARA